MSVNKCICCPNLALIFDVFEDGVWRSNFNYCSVDCYNKRNHTRLIPFEDGYKLPGTTEKKSNFIEPMRHTTGTRESGGKYNGKVADVKQQIIVKY